MFLPETVTERLIKEIKVAEHYGFDFYEVTGFTDAALNELYRKIQNENGSTTE